MKHVASHCTWGRQSTKAMPVPASRTYSIKQGRTRESLRLFICEKQTKIRIKCRGWLSLKGLSYVLCRFDHQSPLIKNRTSELPASRQTVVMRHKALYSVLGIGDSIQCSHLKVEGQGVGTESEKLTAHLQFCSMVELRFGHLCCPCL